MLASNLTRVPMANNYDILGKEVSINSVDKELRLLWEADEATSKASLINFIIYSEEEGSILKNCDAVSEITREHSCRAILMELDRDGDDPKVRSWITSHCNLSGGKKAVCCEQIAFLVGGYLPGIVRHTLFSHLDSDLPLVIWWQGNFSESFRESFYSKIDRLIIDSSKWTDCVSQYVRVEQALKEAPNLVIQDLSWTRSYYFRLAFAGLVDQPAILQNLSAISQVSLTAPRRERATALQLVAWLAELSCYELVQKVSSDASDVMMMRNKDGKEVKFTVSYDAALPTLSSLEVCMGDYQLKIHREIDRPLLCQQILHKGDSMLKRHCPADQIEHVALITDQLSRGGKNSLFKKILPMALRMLSEDTI